MRCITVVVARGLLCCAPRTRFIDAGDGSRTRWAASLFAAAAAIWFTLRLLLVAPLHRLRAQLRYRF